MTKQGKQPKRNGLNGVLWGLLVLVLLFLFSPFITFLLYGGQVGDSRAVSCESNMKQLGLALSQYSQDNDETLPRAMTADGQGWHEATYPYVKSTGVYRYPDDKRGSSQDAPDHLPKSYAANAAVLGGGIASANQNAISAVDTRGYEGEGWDMTSPAFLPDSGRELYAHLPRHIFYEHPEGTVNCLFADGHVKAKKPADTLTPMNLWTRDNAPFTGQDLANAQAILTHAEKE